jgi:hypothetical protein
LHFGCGQWKVTKRSDKAVAISDAQQSQQKKWPQARENIFIGDVGSWHIPQLGYEGAASIASCMRNDGDGGYLSNRRK